MVERGGKQPAQETSENKAVSAANFAGGVIGNCQKPCPCLGLDPAWCLLRVSLTEKITLLDIIRTGQFRDELF